MTKQSELQILKQAKLADTKSVEHILREYKGLVNKICKQYYIVGSDSDDIQQIGMLGLVKAIKTFDEKKQTSFKTFATLCISSEIQSAVRHANIKKNKINQQTVYCDFSTEDLTNEILPVEQLEKILISKEPNPEEQMIINEDTKRAEKMISNNLTELEKSILMLYLDNQSYSEIAKILETNKKSIDNALSRIKQKISKMEIN